MTKEKMTAPVTSVGADGEQPLNERANPPAMLGRIV